MTKLENQIIKNNTNVYQLSLKSKVARTTIIHLISGDYKWKNIRMNQVVNLANTLHCKLSDLVEGDKLLEESIKKLEKATKHK